MTPVGVFFICQNEDKCHFVNSTMVRRIFLHSPINNDKIQVNRYCNAKGEKHEYY